MSRRPAPHLRSACALGAVVAAALLAGCAVSPGTPARAVYDLGPAGPASTRPGTVAWRIADVTASPSAAGDGLAYRLAFRQAQRLEFYRDSTWAAPPAALLTQRLREQPAPPAACPGRAPALVTVHLDAFEQVFTSPTQSHVVLRVQATLWPAQGAAATQQQWQLTREAPSPDAAGAVRGLAEAVDAWLPQWTGWLASVGCR